MNKAHLAWLRYEIQSSNPISNESSLSHALVIFATVSTCDNFIINNLPTAVY